MQKGLYQNISWTEILSPFFYNSSTLKSKDYLYWQCIFLVIAFWFVFCFSHFTVQHRSKGRNCTKSELIIIMRTVLPNKYKILHIVFCLFTFCSDWPKLNTKIGLDHTTTHIIPQYHHTITNYLTCSKDSRRLKFGRQH